LVARNGVHRDADEFGIHFLKLREEFVIERRLISADWTPITRVKKQDDRMAAEVAQCNRLIRGALEGEIGSRRTGGERRRFVSHKKSRSVKVSLFIEVHILVL